VIGPDYSIAGIFTPLVIGLVAASGVVLLAVGYYFARSCCSSRLPPMLFVSPVPDVLFLFPLQARYLGLGPRQQAAAAWQ
jgi:hypothetical protein